MEKLLTITEVAEWLDVTRGQLYRLMDDGLPWIKVGERRRFDRVAVTTWLDRNKMLEREGKK